METSRYRVNDIMNSDGVFFSRTEIENKFRIRIPYLKYYQIVSSIKSVLTKTPKIISSLTEKDNKIQKLMFKERAKSNKSTSVLPVC